VSAKVKFLLINQKLGGLSGKESEIVFIPQKIADRLKEYIQTKWIK